MIGIVDYGMGNLFSVSKGLERLGADSFISDDPKELSKSKGIILPGVGSFRDAMSLLEKQKLDEFLRGYVADGGYLLGICLGMQLLFDESEENGPAKDYPSSREKSFVLREWMRMTRFIKCRTWAGIDLNSNTHHQ